MGKTPNQRLFGLEFDFEVLLPAAYVSFKDVGEFFFLPCYDLENIFAILELGKCSICFPYTKFVINIF